MSKSEDEAYDLFEMLGENSISHSSLSSYERMIGPAKRTGLYEVKNQGESENMMDINALTQKLNKIDTLAQKMEKVDLVAQKLDQLLSMNRQESSFSFAPQSQPFSDSTHQEICVLCSSPNHAVTDCPTTGQLPPFI